MVAQKMLASLGHEVRTAADGEQALEPLSEAAYGLVLMDCQMPVLDGYAATRRWREQETARGAARLPIIAMTANAMAGDRSAASRRAWTITCPSRSPRTTGCMLCSSCRPCRHRIRHASCAAVSRAEPCSCGTDHRQREARRARSTAASRTPRRLAPPSTPPGSDATAPVLDELLDELPIAEPKSRSSACSWKMRHPWCSSCSRPRRNPTAQMQEAAHSLNHPARTSAPCRCRRSRSGSSMKPAWQLQRPAVAVALLVAEHSPARASR
jgi:CheY-like chemotaxis protein